MQEWLILQSYYPLEPLQQKKLTQQNAQCNESNISCNVCTPIQTQSLVVDNFGIKYIGQENAQHLIDALKYFYEVEIDWKGKLYCGIILEWHYDTKYVNIVMPKYVNKQLIR